MKPSLQALQGFPVFLFIFYFFYFVNPRCGRVLSFDSLPIFSANRTRQNRRRLHTIREAQHIEPSLTDCSWTSNSQSLFLYVCIHHFICKWASDVFFIFFTARLSLSFSLSFCILHSRCARGLSQSERNEMRPGGNIFIFILSTRPYIGIRFTCVRHAHTHRGHVRKRNKWTRKYDKEKIFTKRKEVSSRLERIH